VISKPPSDLDMTTSTFAAPEDLAAFKAEDLEELKTLPSSFTRMPVRICTDATEACTQIAKEISECIREKQQQATPCVLGLATGSTPVGVYQELVRLHREEGLSFKSVVTFNLDEYFPMAPNELQSYVRFMREHLFDHVDIAPENIHIPDGTLPVEQVSDYCRWYEQEIRDAGGIDIQVLGIGRTGHIGFNEPGSDQRSRTRLITLDRVTRVDAASDFFGEEHVPRRAITMGVGTILDARRVILISFGEHKASVVAQAVEGPIDSSIAASFLQEHHNAEVVLDEAAAAELTECRSPWLVGTSSWEPETIRKAVIWLACKCGAPILKLTDEDYNEAGLQDLLAEHGPSYDINLNVFRQLQATITGWPGGKPQLARQPGDRPQPNDNIFPKRIVIFSPHPDDDVISMGGTLLRLVDQGHEVHVAYQTSGNIAVFDDDAARYADFFCELSQTSGNCKEYASWLSNHVAEHIDTKLPGEVDSDQIQSIKGLIRRCETRAAGRICGLSTERMHFLDMPFYETGRVKKKELADGDIALIVDLLQKLQPHQIYAAGDLTDPHGTHRTCLEAVVKAMETCQGNAWANQCDFWLYRGAWQEWSPHEIEMAVPLSPGELSRKRTAVFKHESQKDRALFPGSDAREFWQRAEDRNRETANLYNLLGLAEYEAIEGFVRRQV